MKTKRLVYICDWLPPDFGAVGQYAVLFARQWASEGWGVTLVGLTRSGRTLIVTTHDDEFAREFAQRVIILAEGEVVEEGAAREVLTHPKHPATRALLQGSPA